VKIIALAAFLGALLALPYQQWFGTPEENRENRKLEVRPAIPMTRQELQKYPGAFSSYMDDNFGFRSYLLRAYHHLLVSMGTSPSEKVVLGKSGWLFYTNQKLTDQNRGALPLDEDKLSRYLDRFRAQREWVEGLGADYVLLPTPDKNTMYPEHLPDWVKVVGPSRYDQVLDYLKQQSEPFVREFEPDLVIYQFVERSLYWQPTFKADLSTGSN